MCHVVALATSSPAIVVVGYVVTGCGQNWKTVDLGPVKPLFFGIQPDSVNPDRDIFKNLCQTAVLLFSR